MKDYYKMMRRIRHLLKDEYSDLLVGMQEEVDRRWERLKARSENPLL